MRYRVYIGHVCSHAWGGVCLQPPPAGQGYPDNGKCFPLTRNMKLEVLPGKLSEYQ
jgi:hypothetical protein